MSLPLPILPPLSPRQLALLRYLWAFYEEHRYFPTHRECAAALQLKSSQVGGYLEPLVKKGYAVRVNQARRNIMLTPLALDRLKLQGITLNQTLLPLTS